MCYDRVSDTFAYLTHEDRSDDVTKCFPVADVVDVSKWTYYAVRLIKYVLSRPPPP